MSRALQTIMIDARAIWAAARVPGAKPLDDAEAAELARRLAWAKTWYETAKSVAPGEKKRLQSISSMATRLARYLRAGDGVTLDRLQSLWLAGVDLSQSDNLTGDDVLRMLDSLATVADDALKHQRGDFHLRNKFGSPEQIYILRIAGIYRKFASREAGFSNDTASKNNKDHGPFPRLIAAASKSLGIPCPSIDTIRAALADGGEAEKN